MNEAGRVKQATGYRLQATGLAISRSLSSVLMGARELILGSRSAFRLRGIAYVTYRPREKAPPSNPLWSETDRPQRIAERYDLSDVGLQFCSSILALCVIPWLRKEETLISAGSR